MSDLFSLPVHEIAEKIKDGKITSVEICKQYIDRINKYEKDIKAWVHFDKKLLLEKAEEADTNRLDKINVVKFWRLLTGHKKMDVDYWLTRIENELY